MKLRTVARLALLFVLAVLFLPSLACASDATGDVLGGLVGLVSENPRVSAFLGLVTLVQHAAPFLAMVPAIWGGNTGTTGAGSGWSRFWRRVESFPQVGGSSPSSPK